MNDLERFAHETRGAEAPYEVRSGAQPAPEKPKLKRPERSAELLDADGDPILAPASFVKC